jgi:hypothetical protein
MGKENKKELLLIYLFLEGMRGLGIVMSGHVQGENKNTFLEAIESQNRKRVVFTKYFYFRGIYMGI